MKKILLKHGDVKKLANAMHCTTRMVHLSTTYKANTLLAQKIRYVAVEQFGGVEVKMN